MHFLEDGDCWILDSEVELENNLEWFDSTKSDWNVAVKDKLGRKTVVKVEKLKLVELYLE